MSCNRHWRRLLGTEHFEQKIKGVSDTKKTKENLKDNNKIACKIVYCNICTLYNKGIVI